MVTIISCSVANEGYTTRAASEQQAASIPQTGSILKQASTGALNEFPKGQHDIQCWCAQGRITDDIRMCTPLHNVALFRA